jgi:non-specific serine/threonine protein kinase
MTTSPTGAYRFGRFELQPDERRLLVAGTPVRLGRHAFDLLTVLVERSGHLVTKGHLLERVWPKLVVEENTLQAHVSTLRKILGAEAIATISGQGYRFTPEVTKVDATETSPSAPPIHNLPQQLTSFVGRENEIAEVKHLLGATRLLTLTGTGGCGKTRLAMQVAADRAEAYPDGLWLVEFAAVADPGLVPQTVGNVLGIKEQPGKDLTQTMTEYLAPRHLLLVLDNAEHVLGACAQLADALLRGCARLVIVITSRERLGIAGELTFRVPSLSVPDPKRDATPEQVLPYESARLFVERARLQRPHFTVTAENAPALASICHRLDGIPLAIELAAPRVRSMSVEEVSRRLDQRFGLLTGGSRTALPRHRTLRSLIDWSYDLLSDAEKAALRRVSVFAGGWTLEAAEHVCIGEGVDARDVLDLLTSLVDKSLLVADERDGATRYGLLETVRHYSLDQLRESGEEAHTRRRHLGYFVTMVETAEAPMKGAEQPMWLSRLDTEHDNVRAALTWACGVDGDVVSGLRLAGAFFPFWLLRSFLADGRKRIGELLAAAPRGPAADAARAKALNAAGVLALRLDDYLEARARFGESLEIRRERGDRRGIAVVLHNIGIVDLERSEYASARASLEQSLAIVRELDDRWAVANTLSNLAKIARDQGDQAAARSLYEESLALYRTLGYQHGTGWSLTGLGMIAQDARDYPAARALYEEGLAIFRKAGDRHRIGISMRHLGTMARLQGDFALAEVLFKEALVIGRELGDRKEIVIHSLEGLASSVANAFPGRAARFWGAAERERTDIGSPLPPSDKSDYEQQVAAGRAALGDDAAFDLAWRAGREMTLDEAVQYALGTTGA